MEFLNTVGACWLPDQGCTPRWEAWAVAAAVFAGVGSWLAAVATYWAVIFPLQRRQHENLAVATAVLDNFAAELIDLRYALGTVGFILPMVSPTSEPSQAKKTVQGMARHSIAVPKLIATPETLQLVVSLNSLRRALKKWDKSVATFDISPEPDMEPSFAEYVVDELKSNFRSVMNEIRAVAELIKGVVPAYRSELELITQSGDSFLPLPPAPDVL